MYGVRIMLAAVRRVSAYVRGLSFEALGDLAMSLCIGLGLALLVLGWLVTPDIPALWATDDVSWVVIPKCVGRDNCNLGCTITSLRTCQGDCVFRYPDCIYCYCVYTDYLEDVPIACGCR
ncbi:MAG: hypothetical protein RMI91_10390 [Gemmatales bacterium]|nr:hypothetical protein [Gemmatales bacterium]